MPRCRGETRAGTGCERLVAEGLRFCHQHAPRDSSGEALKEIGQIKDRLLRLCEEALGDYPERGDYAVAFTGYGQVAKFLELQRKVLEINEISSRLDELEDDQDRQLDGGGYGGAYGW